MTDPWTDRLSGYLDGELAGEDRAGLETHLEQCADCRDALAGLRRVVAHARTLEDRPPAQDLWAGIADRIGARASRPAARTPRRFSFSLPQLAAAGIALATVSGGSAWLLHPGTGPSVTAGPMAIRESTPAVTVAAGRATAGSYDAAVADLEQILAQGRGRLDPTTVRVLERNLATIDSAIAQARRAVAADSANVYLNSHLAATMRRKLELLRQAATLVSIAS
jgi:hypothetical protein